MQLIYWKRSSVAKLKTRLFLLISGKVKNTLDIKQTRSMDSCEVILKHQSNQQVKEQKKTLYLSQRRNSVPIFPLPLTLLGKHINVLTQELASCLFCFPVYVCVCSSLTASERTGSVMRTPTECSQTVKCWTAEKTHRHYNVRFGHTLNNFLCTVSLLIMFSPVLSQWYFLYMTRNVFSPRGIWLEKSVFSYLSLSDYVVYMTLKETDSNCMKNKPTYSLITCFLYSIGCLYLSGTFPEVIHFPWGGFPPVIRLFTALDSILLSNCSFVAKRQCPHTEPGALGSFNGSLLNTECSFPLIA